MDRGEWRLLNSAQPHQQRRLRPPGLLAALPTRRSPARLENSDRTRPLPRATVSASLSGRGMYGIHTPGFWGGTSSPATAKRARDLHIYKWGWGTPLRPARCPASIFPEDFGGVVV